MAADQPASAAPTGTAPAAAAGGARAKILADLAAKSAAPGAPKTQVLGADAPASGSAKPAPKPAEQPKPKAGGDEREAQTIATVAKLSKELRETKEALAKATGGSAKKTVTKDDFLKELRANPGLIFKEIADDPDLLVKLAEARHVDLSPEAQERAAERSRIEALEKEIAETKRTATETQVYNATARILTDGIDAGDVKIPAGKWPLCQRVHKAGDEDVPRAAMNAASAMVKDLGRAPTDAETAQIIEIAYDALEARYRKRAEIYRQEPAKNDTSERRKNPPRTLAGAIGSGGHAPQPPEDKPQNKFQRRQQRLQRLRDENARQAQAG